MNKIIFVLMLIVGIVVSVTSAESATVRGYTKKNGTYVQPHQRTAPDKSRYNNYSTKGNVNPYTGKKGTVDPYKPKLYTPNKSKL